MNSSIESLLKNPIPLDPAQVSGWKEVIINDCHESLVPIDSYTGYKRIAKDAIYFGECETSPYYPYGLNGSLLTPFVRIGLAEKLREAQKLLPSGHLFLIWDAYRPIQVQAALFDFIIAELTKEKPNLSEAERFEEAQRFVSLPSIDPLKPSPHNTGGVVDLTIIKVSAPLWEEIQALEYFSDDSLDKIQEYNKRKSQIIRGQGKLLDMGTPFDSVGTETESNYYERLAMKKSLTLNEQNRLLNRRLLHNALSSVGMRNYPEEWWHFSYGDQMWAKQIDCLAIYGAITLSADNINFESKQQLIYQQEVAKAQTKGISSDWTDPRRSSHTRAVQI